MIRFRLVTAQSSAVNVDGFWGVQSDAQGKSPAWGHFGMMHSFGFISRPVDPDTNNGKGCLVLEGTEGSSEGFSWLCHDPRFYSKIPALSQGSSCVYNSRGAFILLDSDAQTNTFYFPYVDSGAVKAHVMTFGKDANGNAAITIQHGDGSYVSMKDGKVVTRGKGNALLTVDESEVVVNGNFNCPSAGSFGGATPANTLVTGPGFATFVQALVSALGAMTSPTLPPGALATAIEAALTAATATLNTKFLTAL